MLLTNAREPESGEDRRSKGLFAISWIETHCVYTVGRWIGKPTRLTAWEKWFLMHLLSVDENEKRIYRWALLGVPKKNGKTEFAAWLALYFFLADDEPAPWIACSAGSEHQADLVFGAASRCVKYSKTLSQVCDTFDKEITAESVPGGKIMRVTSKAGTNDGPSWHVVICDELHEWGGTNDAGGKLWTTLTNGTGARDNPLILQITTAGYDIESLLGEQYTYCESLIDDPTLDPDYLFAWWTADEKADYTDPATWKDANPSWGITLPDPERFFKSQLGKKTESVFRRYFLNQWTESEDIWLPPGVWDRNEVAPEDFWLDPSLPIFVGIDGAIKRDVFAVVAIQHQAEYSVTWAELWENPYPRGDERRNHWKLDIAKPVAYLRELFETFPKPAMTDEDLGELPGPVFGYDPYNLEFVAQILEGEGLNMVEVPQTDLRMCPATEAVYGELVSDRLKHLPHRRFRRHIHSAVPKYKDRGWRIARPAGTRKPIDAATSLVVAGYLAYQEQGPEDEGPTIW